MWRVEGVVSISTESNDLEVKEDARFYTGRSEEEVRGQAQKYFIEVKGVYPCKKKL